MFFVDCEKRKKQYSIPELEIVSFSVEDIVTSSGSDGDWDSDIGEWDTEM